MIEPLIMWYLILSLVALVVSATCRERTEFIEFVESCHWFVRYVLLLPLELLARAWKE